MAVPPILVAVVFGLACVASIVIMIRMTRRGSKPTDFFSDAVSSVYELQLPEAEIEAYYQLKDKLQRLVESEVSENTEAAEGTNGVQPTQQTSTWVARLPIEKRKELHQALMKRLVSSLDKLEKVQTDKPGTWKLWREKLVSERYWQSLLDGERLVGQEIDDCQDEADEIEPGWKEIIFRQAVNIWRADKHYEKEKKVLKKEVEKQKKAKEKEGRAKELDKKKELEDKIREEQKAEKMMEKLLKEEANEGKKKQKGNATEKAKAKATGKKK